ncbi:uncharacterized protein LOC142219660 [Haematobia irritans]|uniref:uncharacterized protein LOC142219660 n=1 Tax=Haematobia irritans TaxID=7368 RepID=UPI003F50BD73
MKFIGFLIFLGLCVFTFAAVGRGNFTHPDHPGKCVYRNLILSAGETGYPEGKCVRFICSGDEGYGIIHSCGVYGVKPPCFLGDYIDRTAQYPKCCKKHIICPDDNENQN